ncbi:MAG: ribbon-helix-helix protein, CopG family [Chloroflexi bacterium]|nr:ribbon-helix-helix protein, CopG family [Chloroflexota bacterium]
MEVQRAPRYANALTIRFDSDTYAGLEAKARVLDTSAADVVRRAVAEYLASDAAERLQAKLGPVVDRVIGRHINRLAGLIAKSVKAAAMAEEIGAHLVYKIDPASSEQVLDEAEKTAIAYLRGETDTGD